MSSEETGFILGDELTGACAQHCYLLLNLVDIIVAGFEVDLWPISSVNWVDLDEEHTHFIATTSPVVLSMALYTVPKDPLPSSIAGQRGWARSKLCRGINGTRKTSTVQNRTSIGDRRFRSQRRYVHCGREGRIEGNGMSEDTPSRTL